MFSFQIRAQSCGVRVYFVSLSYAFVFSSYPSCVLFMWGLKTSCQIRIQSCCFRVYFVFFSCGFVFSSLCACFIFVGSGKFVSNSYPVVRCSCLFRILFKRFRVQFVTVCVLFMWAVKSWCQVRIQLRCSCFFRILLMQFRVQSRILLLFHLM